MPQAAGAGDDVLVATTRSEPDALLAGYRWLRIPLLLLAGAALVLPVQRVVYALAPTTETRAVLTDVGTHRDGGPPHRPRFDSTAVAVTPDGAGLDLASAGSGRALAALGRGPVVITRSTVDGRPLLVRTPIAVVDIEGSAEKKVLGIGGLLVAVAGLWLGLAGSPRPRAAALLAVPLGAALILLVGWRAHDLVPYQHAVRDAMHNYLDPPTTTPPGPFTFSVDAIVPTGTPAEVGRRARITVTGPPRDGLPDGADRQVERWFDTMHVPLLVDPGTADFGSLPVNTWLIGGGSGQTVRLDPGPACPGAVPSRVGTPHQGYACFAVPDDFVPRYLVFYNDDVAIDLRSSGSGAAGGR